MRGVRCLSVYVWSECVCVVGGTCIHTGVPERERKVQGGNEEPLLTELDVKRTRTYTIREPYPDKLQ